MYVADYLNSDNKIEGFINKIKNNINGNKIALYGKGIYIYETLRCMIQINCDITIFDSNEELWGEELLYEDKLYVIENPEKLYYDKYSAVIIVPFGQVRMNIEENLVRYGYSIEKIYHAFEIIPLLCMEKNEIRLPDIGFLIGNICTLKCKDCVHLVPYSKNFRYRNIDMFKEEVDTFFSKIDFVQLIQVGTGEVLANKNLYKYLRIILEWKEKFGKLQIVSNGTVIPQRKNLDILKDEKIQICVSNYDTKIIDNKNNISHLKEVFNENNIRYIITKYLGGNTKDMDSWSDIGKPNNKRNRSAKANKEICKECSNRPCHLFYKDEIHICLLSAIWDYNGIRNIMENDSVKITRDFQMITSYLGITPNGSPEICDWCDGMGERVNSKLVKAAVQIK